VETVFLVLHVLAAAVWVGGTVALVFVAVPYARTLEGPARAEALAALGRRWRPLGWGAVGVLAITGASLAADEDFFEGTARVVFLVKLGLALVLIGAALLHDLVLGPRLAREIREGRAQASRRRLVLVGWLSFATTIAVPVLGVVLVQLG
jgi:putative copper export protein